MDHVVYLDYKAKELPNLIDGKKTKIIRGAMGRKLPYGKVVKDDVLYFVENNGDGLVKARAVVEAVYNSEKLSKEDSEQLVEENQQSLLLNPGLKKRFAGKRYITLITLKDFKEVQPFKMDRTDYGNMDDWLPVGEIERVMIK